MTQRQKGQQVTAPLRYGGGSGNINSCAFNKHCAGRQFSASNPPQRKAAKRYTPARHDKKVVNLDSNKREFVNGKATV